MLSIDVGIKNLSFCLFNDLQVLKWDNIDLTEVSKNQCMGFDAHGMQCEKSAKFIKDSTCFCLKHSKKTHYLQPSSDLVQTFLNKQKIQQLIDIAEKYNIKHEPLPKKQCLIQLLNDFSVKNCFTAIKKNSAVKMDLVTIGRNMQHKFDEILEEHINTIDTIIIENQIGPIANKMKTIQGMIAQYFIMKNNNIKIEFISATNKLKDFITTEKMDYKQRKKLGIQTCLQFVSTDEHFIEWNMFFNKHHKKDDLSDCFLQGMWYIKHKL